MRGIGETARASGLSVSALRFYDGAGVLVPAMVDPGTGYRRYAEHQVRAARLVAGLRRVGMPLADISRVLDQLGDPDAVRRLLDAHLRRLEDGLTDARRELSRVHALLDSEEIVMSVNPTRITIAGSDLAAALDAVRFAVGDDPDLPALHGVLIEVESSGLHLVATDRYRLAVSRAPLAQVDGPPVRVIAPASFIDQVRALLVGPAEVVLTVGADTIAVETGGRRVGGQPVDVDFPDYRRLLGEQVGDARRVTVDVPALRRALAPGTAPTVVREHGGIRHPVAVLAVDPAGKLAVVAEDSWRADPDGHVAVNREFLLEALDAGGGGQLELGLDGPIRPLAVRSPEHEGTFSILMPIRL
ncbi:MAG TPA: MerR family transcriptional regulator [Catenuloplanes sp.]